MVETVARFFSAIPAAVWLFVVSQFVLTLVWAVRIDARVDVVERRQNENVHYLTTIEIQTRQIALLDERQRVANEQSVRLQRQIELLINTLSVKP